jgi:hypothetical protein
MAVGEIVDRASDRLVGLVESAAQRSQILPRKPALFEFGTGFLPPETDAQKRR